MPPGKTSHAKEMETFIPRLAKFIETKRANQKETEDMTEDM